MKRCSLYLKVVYLENEIVERGEGCFRRVYFVVPFLHILNKISCLQRKEKLRLRRFIVNLFFLIRWVGGDGVCT